MSWSRVLSILAAFGAALAGITTLLGELDPLYGTIAMLIATFITIFCERVQGGASKE